MNVEDYNRCNASSMRWISINEYKNADKMPHLMEAAECANGINFQVYIA